jgi:hypothetical protein
MVLAGSLMTGNAFASPLPCGTSATRILKERLFGVTNSEGNHGEDVKEYYFYLDSTPAHAYMKYLYKYPQREYPYLDLIETNRRRSRKDFEYELIDTGIFEDDRYFDVFVDYAKESPNDILVRITVCNRGPEAARLHVLPTLWFRNNWSWSHPKPKPVLSESDGRIQAAHSELGEYWLTCEGSPELSSRKMKATPSASGPAKSFTLGQRRIPSTRYFPRF